MATGVAVSPNRESDRGNALIFGALGAALAAGTSYVLYQDDPRNYKLDHMLMGKINLNDAELPVEMDKKGVHPVPVMKMPKKLQDKVVRQHLIKHKSREQFIQKGESTYYIPSFDIFEHSYENTFRGDK